MPVAFAKGALSGQLILVTGASSGLGRAACALLSELGARVVLVGRNTDRLQLVVETMSGSGHIIKSANLSSDDAADELVKSIVLESGPLNGVFHSAGNSGVVPIRLTKRSHIDDMFGAAVFGALGISRALARKGTMHNGGSIVFMTSVSAIRGRKGMVAYSAAKAATSGLLRALAIELAERQIRVNGIAAGAVATEMHESFVKSVNDEMVKNYESLHPLGFGLPSDIANTVAFLMSDASRWITGVNLSVDGGYAAK